MSGIEVYTEEALRDPDIKAFFGEEALKYDLAMAIIIAREQRRLTHATLAQMTGLRSSYLAKLEQGAVNPTLSRVGALFAAMDMKLQLTLAPLCSVRNATGRQPAREESVEPQEHQQDN